MISVCADLHLWNHPQHAGALVEGLNERAREGLGVLADACRAAAGQHLLILGDVLHKVRPEPQLLTAIRSLLLQGPRHVTILAGNHDRVSGLPLDHALGPLAWPGRIDVVATPVEGAAERNLELLLAPHEPVEDLEQHVERLVREWVDRGLADHRALFLHVGIRDASMPAWQQGLRSVSEPWLRDLCRQNEINFVFSGDWHQARVWRPRDQDGITIVQCGTLIPHSFSDAGVEYGAVWHLDEGVVSKTIIPGPRFIENDLELAKSLTRHQVYYRERVPADEVAARRAELTPLGFRALEVLPIVDEREAVTAARVAALDLEQAVRRVARTPEGARKALQYLAAH